MQHGTDRHGYHIDSLTELYSSLPTPGITTHTLVFFLIDQKDFGIKKGRKWGGRKGGDRSERRKPQKISQ